VKITHNPRQCCELHEAGSRCGITKLISNIIPVDEISFFRFRIFKICSWKTAVVALGAILLLALGCGCEVERRRSDTDLGLTPQQAAGRHVYDQYCDRCHAPYSSKKRQGPSLRGLFKREYLPVSGMPANDDRARDIIRMGRNKMDGFGNVLTDEQINDLLAYLHTL
jgi:mono/diheme cytochrome c family protein